jgi:hypothetical protein
MVDLIHTKLSGNKPIDICIQDLQNISISLCSDVNDMTVDLYKLSGWKARTIGFVCK